MKRQSLLVNFVLLTIAIVILATVEAVVAVSLSLRYETRLVIGAAISGAIVFIVYRSPGSWRQ